MFLDRIELTPVQDDGSTAICTIIFPIIEIDQGRFGWFDDGFGYQPHDIVQSSKKHVMVWRRPSKRVSWRLSGRNRGTLSSGCLVATVGRSRIQQLDDNGLVYQRIKKI